MENNLNNISVNFKLNGEETNINVPSNTTLLEVLRNHLGITGTKEGCGTGECGACTVLINGNPELACITLIGTVEGKEILTIEGSVAGGPLLKSLQVAFLEEGAVQCGYCTPGMILSSYALLSKVPKPSREEIKESMSGNICRCTGYKKIINAIENVSKQLGGEAE